MIFVSLEFCTRTRDKGTSITFKAGKIHWHNFVQVLAMAMTYTSVSVSMRGYFYWDGVLFNRRVLFSRLKGQNLVRLRRPLSDNEVKKG